MECAHFPGGLFIRTHSQCKPSNLSLHGARRSFICCSVPGNLNIVMEKTQPLAVVGVDGRGFSDCDTGIPFLDHMLDQIPHHGLFDLQIRTSHAETDVARSQLAGSALGEALRLALQDRVDMKHSGLMYLPLDEALVKAAVVLDGDSRFDYGLKVPRQMVGRYETRLVEEFFRCLVQASGMSLSLTQYAGRNSHHIIEAAFKSFAKALRQAADVSRSPAGTWETPRVGKVRRVTTDRQVDIDLRLDGRGECRLNTGNSHLDRLLEAVVHYGKLDLKAEAFQADDVHLFEDTASALGAACLEALGDRKGIQRFGYSCEQDDPFLVSLDLSGRPHLEFNVENNRNLREVMYFFKSLTRTSGMTLHIYQVSSSPNNDSLIEAIAQGFGAALKSAVSQDTRRRDSIPSSKGVLTRA